MEIVGPSPEASEPSEQPEQSEQTEGEPLPEPAFRRPDGLTLVAIYELCSAVLLLIIFSLLTLYLILALRAMPSEEVSLVLGIALALAVLGILFAIASAAVGWGLLGRRGWARVGGMLLAIPALLGLPIWTAFSILVLIYLHGDEAKAAVNVNSEPA